MGLWEVGPSWQTQITDPGAQLPLLWSAFQGTASSICSYSHRLSHSTVFSYYDRLRPSGTMSQNNISFLQVVYFSYFGYRDTNITCSEYTKYAKYKVLQRPDPASIDTMVTITGFVDQVILMGVELDSVSQILTTATAAA